MILNIFRRFFRKRIRARPFPPEWEAILQKSFPAYGRLNLEDRRILQGHIQVFIAEKAFEGCLGLEITDEMRVLVAAQACLLILNRESDFYPDLVSILIYPDKYKASTQEVMPGGVIVTDNSVRLGESWTRGTVVLSWKAIQYDTAHDQDGHNLVYHEFVHQLDYENGATDGVPKLGEGLDYPHRKLEYLVWAKVMVNEYDELRIAKKHGRKTLLDYYGAQNHAEFFAVATEAFFEKSTQMLKRHPELYSELKDYYYQDPASWPKE